MAPLSHHSSGESLDVGEAAAAGAATAAATISATASVVGTTETTTALATNGIQIMSLKDLQSNNVMLKTLLLQHGAIGNNNDDDDEEEEHIHGGFHGMERRPRRRNSLQTKADQNELSSPHHLTKRRLSVHDVQHGTYQIRSPDREMEAAATLAPTPITTAAAARLDTATNTTTTSCTSGVGEIPPYTGNHHHHHHHGRHHTQQQEEQKQNYRTVTNHHHDDDVKNYRYAQHRDQQDVDFFIPLKWQEEELDDDHEGDDHLKTPHPLDEDARPRRFSFDSTMADCLEEDEIDDIERFLRQHR